MTADLITTTREIKIDLTRGTDYASHYEQLVNEEIEHYSEVEVTPDLREGGIHALDSWSFYFDWLEKHLFHTSFHDEIVEHANRVDGPRLLSLGWGYGGHNLISAGRLRKPFELMAVQLNPHITAEATRRAQRANLNVTFVATDLNFVSLRPNSFDVVYAHASLHHLLNLEHVFDQIAGALKDQGVLIVLGVIGQEQVLFWRENVEFAANLLKTLPLRYRPPHGGGCRATSRSTVIHSRAVRGTGQASRYGRA